MPRLTTMSFDDVRRIIARNGFEFARQSKHDAIYVHPDDPTRRVGIPRHKKIAKGTLLSIIRDSKKPREHFTTP